MLKKIMDAHSVVIKSFFNQQQTKVSQNAAEATFSPVFWMLSILSDQIALFYKIMRRKVIPRIRKI